MEHVAYYKSPLGLIILKSEDGYLKELSFTDKRTQKETSDPVLEETKRYLDVYFKGEIPERLPPYKPEGTPFAKEVYALLENIPYGKTVTYGDLANVLAAERGIRKMSARAVGNAVGRNPLSIIVPCHRVLGKNNALTGYGGGLERKVALLKLEGIDVSCLRYPKK